MHGDEFARGLRARHESGAFCCADSFIATGQTLTVAGYAGRVACRRASMPRATRNAHLCASCAQILGNNECFEPYTSNIYVRRVLSGEFTVVNQHLLQDLTRLGLWNRDLKNELVHRDGSVQAR